MDTKELNNLREVFRARMRREDFCIGEEQVEKLFRELLGEPEPNIEFVFDKDRIDPKIIRQELEKAMRGIKIEDLFNCDDQFFKHIRRK